MSWKKEIKFVNECRREFSSAYISKKDRRKRNAFQKKYGFSYEEAWNLDTELAFYLLPRIAYLKKHKHGMPTKLCKIDHTTGEITNYDEALAQWDLILKTIIKGLHYHLEETVYLKLLSAKKQKTWTLAKQYLAEYYDDLWD